MQRRDHLARAEHQGVGPYARNASDGRRMGAALTHLIPALGRPNLTVRGGAVVHRVAFDGTRAVGVDVESAFDVTTSPSGARPVTDATLSTEPASTSAWVIVYVAVQVVAAPCPRVVAEQVVVPTLASATATVRSVTAPVLVTVKV